MNGVPLNAVMPMPVVPTPRHRFLTDSLDLIRGWQKAITSDRIWLTVHRPDSGTMTGRIGTEFSVRAPIRVRQVRRHRIACTGADDFGDRGLRQRLRLALRQPRRDVTDPVPAWRQAACLRTVHSPT